MSGRRNGIVVLTQSTAFGGMETQALYLAQGLARRGERVTMVVPRDPAFDRIEQAATASGLDAWRFDSDARSGRLSQLREVVSLWRRLRAATVLHVHTGGVTGGVAPALAGRLAGCRVVRTEHDVPGARPRLAQRLSTFLADRACHVVIAVSRRNAELRARRLRRPRGHAVVLNGVEIPRAEDAVPAQHVFGPGDVVIGCVVRLAEGKGLHDLMRAFALVGVEYPEARLLLVGDGPLRTELEALGHELGIGGSVVFAGYQLNPAAFFAQMDIFALAVPAGSMSIALLEAMAHGLPPVITFGGPEEAVIPDVTGLTARPEDPADLACALSRLVADPGLRRTLSERARAHCAHNYSVERVVADHLALYRGAPPARLSPSSPPDRYPGGYRPEASEG